MAYTAKQSSRDLHTSRKNVYQKQMDLLFVHDLKEALPNFKFYYLPTYFAHNLFKLVTYDIVPTQIYLTY